MFNGQAIRVATYLGRLIRFHRNIQRVTRFHVFSTLQQFRLRSRTLLLASGGTTGLAVSFFGKPKEKPTDVSNLLLIIRESDALYDNYMIENAYNILRKHSKGTCPELLWRLARVLCEKGKLSKDKNERKRLIYEAFETAKRALDYEDEDGCFGAHKWYAILLNYVGEYESTKDRIRNSYEVRRHLEKALEINPNDATTWHILGVWHFTFADMPSYTRLIAKTIFDTPPSSSYEEALKYFEKAEYISPNFYSTNTWYMAEVNDRLGQKDVALNLYQKAFKMPVISADDGEIHKKAHEKLKKLGVKDAELV